MIKKRVLTFHALMQTRPYVMDLLLFSVSMNLPISILGVIFMDNCVHSQVKAQRMRKDGDSGLHFQG